MKLYFHSVQVQIAAADNSSPCAVRTWPRQLTGRISGDFSPLQHTIFFNNKVLYKTDQ